MEEGVGGRCKEREEEKGNKKESPWSLHKQSEFGEITSHYFITKMSSLLKYNKIGILMGIGWQWAWRRDMQVIRMMSFKLERNERTLSE